MADEGTPAGNPDFVEQSGEIYVAETELQAGAVGLTGAIMQNITHIAPAIAAFFFTQTIVGFSGAHAPLAYLCGFLIVLALGLCLVQLAKKFPSAGGYYTYVSRTLGPRLGFLTGWMFTFYSPIVAGPLFAYFGYILENELASNYGWTWFHWWMIVAVGIPLIAVVGYMGIALSIRAIVVVGICEFAIVLALCLWGLFDPGPGGFTVKSFSYGFNPGDIATLSGFTLAIVFTVQGLTGWEAAVPLAEETENPRRNVPRATMWSIFIIGCMLVIAMWGQTVGWGVNRLPSLISSGELPALVLSHKYWGSLWWLALLAMFTSTVGASLACQNVATRMWFGMGRSGVLPAQFAKVDPVRKTPTAAVTAQLVLSLILGLFLPLWLNPTEIFLLSVGYTLVLAVIFVYVISNIAVVVYYWRDARSEFNWILHFIFPVGTSLVLIYSVYKSFYPILPWPYDLAPYLAGGWLILGIVVMFAMTARGNTEWLTKAAAIVGERPETPEEVATTHRHAL